MVGIEHPRTKKAVSNLRARLLGAAMENKEWYRAVDALEFAIEKHDGVFRKDKTTPYILHPVDVARFVLTLPNLMYRTDSVAASLLHDVREDCGVSHQELVTLVGTMAADAVECMTKKCEGLFKKEVFYFSELAKNPCGSILKPADRINNQLTLEVFTPAKALETVQFTEDHIIPMMKTARRRFCEQELAYENMKLILELQIRNARVMFEKP